MVDCERQASRISGSYKICYSFASFLSNLYFWARVFYYKLSLIVPLIKTLLLTTISFSITSQRLDFIFHVCQLIWSQWSLKQSGEWFDIFYCHQPNDKHLPYQRLALRYSQAVLKGSMQAQSFDRDNSCVIQ